MKIEKIMIGTVLADIGTFFISFLILIDPFSVQPFIKRTTMIEHSVQNNTNVSLMCLLTQLCEQLVAGFQIPETGNTADITAGIPVVMSTLTQQFSFILQDHTIMRINIIVILNIILVIGRRYKQRIEINGINTQALDIIQLIHNPLKIPAVKTPHIQSQRVIRPVSRTGGRNSIHIQIFSVQYIIGRISVAETIHKNLIENGTLCPSRYMHTRAQHKTIAALCLLSNPKLVVTNLLFPFFHNKIIPERILSHRHTDFIKIKPGIKTNLFFVSAAFKSHNNSFFPFHMNQTSVAFLSRSVLCFYTACLLPAFSARLFI